MNWKHITTVEYLEQINEESKRQNVMIFKHSTRCSISDTALGRLQRNWKEEDERELNCYFLDLLKYRNISDLIAEKYKVVHQSPQALVIRDGICVISQSHSEIQLKDLLEA